MAMPTLRLAMVAPLTPKILKVVELPTSIVAAEPSNCSIVIVEAVGALTWPETRGRITLIAVSVDEPSLAFDSLNPIESPTLRSDSEIDCPPRVILVELVMLMVRVQPWAVLSARFEPSIEATVTPPNAPNPPNPPPNANPPPLGPADPRPNPPKPD